MTEQQYQLHKAADARAIARLSRENSIEIVDSTPDAANVAQDELTVKSNRIKRHLGLPINPQSKRWEGHRAMLASIHAEIAPKLQALKVARRDLFQELYTIPVRQQ